MAMIESVTQKLYDQDIVAIVSVQDRTPTTGLPRAVKSRISVKVWVAGAFAAADL